MESINSVKYGSFSLTVVITLIIFLCFTITQALIVTCLLYLYPELSYEYLAYSNLGLISIISSTISFFVLAVFIRLKNNIISTFLNISTPKINVVMFFLLTSLKST